jgi:hypothetical protein
VGNLGVSGAGQARKLACATGEEWRRHAYSEQRVGVWGEQMRDTELDVVLY